jgi:flavin reductase (DIM6/NTAB) family NADH-FMN oxidoreductase RutF/AcrR family transcriptional regulator
MESEAPAIAADMFRNVLSHYPTGVSIVTGDVADIGPVGLVVGTFTSLSLEPAMVSFMPAKSSTSWPKIQSSGSFCVNVLGANQGDLCKQFSARGGKKFEGVDWRPAATGSPILDGAMAWVDCRIEQVFDSGDHQIVVGRVVDLRVESDELPMAFLRGSFGQVHLPQPSPSAHEAATVDADDVHHQLAGEVAELLGLEAFDYRAWVESREEVVEKLLIGFIEAMLSRFDDLDDDGEVPEEQLRSLISVSLKSMRDYSAAAIMFQRERSTLGPESSRRLEVLESEFRRRWTAVIERGVASGSFGEVDPRLAQQVLSDGLFSVARWFREGGRLQREDVEDAYTEFALNVVRRLGAGD